MFGLWFHIKVKLWLLAIHGAISLLEYVEKRAEKSVGQFKGGTFVINEHGKILAGLIGGGTFVTDCQGNILAGILKSGEGITVFGPN
jgi:hypothetical protein